MSLRWISWKVFPPGFYTGEGDLPPSPPVFLGLVHFFLIFLKEGGETISERLFYQEVLGTIEHGETTKTHFGSGSSQWRPGRDT